MITAQQIETAVNKAFSSIEEFDAMLQIMAGVGVRVKKEIELNATIGEIQKKQAELQEKQAELQRQSVYASQQTQEETDKLQLQASELRAEIDAINSRLPDLL